MLVGTVRELWRYPVKSMRGERCEHLEIDHRGAIGDRLYAVRDEAGKFGSGKTTRRFRRIDQDHPKIGRLYYPRSTRSMRHQECDQHDETLQSPRRERRASVRTSAA